MTARETILVPIDFGDASREALARARDLGDKLGMEIVLLHVYTIPVVVYPGADPLLFPGFSHDIAAGARRALDELAAASGDSRTILREGDPAAEILATVEGMRPSLLVMGTQGRRGLARVLLGSVAEKLVRLSPVPVLTVHAAKP